MGFAASVQLLSVEWLSRGNMGCSVCIFDFCAEAPKLGQWSDNSRFLPASCEAVASLYPSWQQVRVPGEQMGSRTAQRTPKYLSDVGK